MVGSRNSEPGGIGPSATFIMAALLFPGDTPARGPLPIGQGGMEFA